MTRAPRAGRRWPLVLDTVRAHRAGAIAWVGVGGLTMFGMAAALAEEMADFPGGAQGLAASVTPAAEAMRLLRWPAERLDTLGGYLTFHNVILFNFFLAIYGCLQGARDLRGSEERGSLEEILATGHARAAIVRDRAVGFALVAALISLAIGLGVAAGLAAGHQPDLAGSLITMGTSGLVAMVGYALGTLVSQLVGSVRAAGGFGSAVICALYLATNVEDRLGPAGFVRFASPFHYANRSRALVPGYGLDFVATAALVAMVAALLALTAWAFARRDYAAPLWVPRARTGSATTTAAIAAVPRRMFGSIAAATIRRGWRGMAIWAAGAAAFTAMFAALQPAVMDMWTQLDFLTTMTGATGATDAADAYWSFVGEFVTPVLAAYVITQSSGWVADLLQGRVEMILAAPVSWSMLVRGRLIAAAVGAAAIITGALLALEVGAAAVGSSPSPAGLGRVVVVGVLFSAALAASAAVVVAVVRRPLAATLLAVLVAASYLVSFLVPLFGWPEWLNRLSIFWAFGHPYLAWPSAAQWAVLLTVAIAGTLAAGALAERTPKVP